ncbi:MAG TPA: AraC family transcriptional regulator [Lachnospiraceae bacterium]|nr:AraC family transcriptional regulator [Lachnospiraceae bacterium]HPF28506.1 AraC family transcriptional regulator [Lachnospiraceae bacterium]
MLFTNYCNYNFSNPDYDVIDRPNGNQEYLFLYFQTPMEVRLNGTIYSAQPGACLLIPPHITVYYRAVCHFKNSFVHFDGEECADLIAHYPCIPLNKLFYLSDLDSVNRILKSIYMEYVTKNEFFEDAIDTLLRSLLTQIARQLSTSSVIPTDILGLYDIFQSARLNILTHPEKDWDADSMAALTHLGCSQFYHYYQHFFKLSPKAELIDARLEKARYLLLHESFSVAVVAEYCGFNNLAHFTRYFKKQFGITPGHYRMKQGISTE